MTEENNLLETRETNYQRSKSLTVYLKSFASNKAQFSRVLDDVKVKKDDCEIVAKHLSYIKMTNTGRQNRLISHKQKTLSSNNEKKLDGPKENIHRCHCRSWQLVATVKYTFYVIFLCAGSVHTFFFFLNKTAYH